MNYDSRNSGVVFSIPSISNISHFHGHLAEERPIDFSRTRAEFLKFDSTNYRCPYSKTGCRAGFGDFPGPNESSVGFPYGEGNSSTSWTCACTKCGAQIIMSGPFAGYFLNMILSFGTIYRDPGYGVFKFAVPKFNFVQEISDHTAKFCLRCVPHIFDGQALEQFTEECVMGEEFEPIEYAGEEFRKSITSFENQVDDKTGFNVCTTRGGIHDWLIQSTNWKMSLPLGGGFNAVFDHILICDYVKAKAGHSIRAINMAGIFGFNPRITPLMIHSYAERSTDPEIKRKGPTAYANAFGRRFHISGLTKRRGKRPNIREVETIIDNIKKAETVSEDRVIEKEDSDQERDNRAVQVYREPSVRSDDEEEFDQRQDEEAPYGYEIDQDGQYVPIEDDPDNPYDSFDEQDNYVAQTNTGESEAESIEDEHPQSKLEEVELDPVPFDEEEYFRRGEEMAAKEIADFEESEEGSLHIARSLVSRIGTVIRCGGRLIKGCHRVIDWPVEKFVHLCDESGKFLQGANVSTTMSDGTQVDYWTFISEVWPEFVYEVAKIAEITHEHLEIEKQGFTDLYADLGEFCQGVVEFATAVETNVNAQNDNNRQLVEAINKVALKKNSAACTKCDRLAANFVKLSDRMAELTEIVEGKEDVSREISERYLSSRDVENITKKMIEPLRAIQTDHTKMMDDIAEKIRSLQEALDKMGVSIENIPISDSIRQAAFGRSKTATAFREALEEKEEISGVGNPVVETAIANADQSQSTSVTPSGTISGGEQISILESLTANVQLGVFTWQSSHTSGTVFHTFHLPEAIFQKSSIVKACYELFQYFVCDGIEITVATVSPISQGGILVVAWDPMSSANRRKYTNGFSLSPLDSLWIKAGSNVVGTMFVSYESIQTQLSLAGEEAGTLCLGSIIVWPNCKLIASEGSSDKCQVTVTCKFRNPVFKMRTTHHSFAMKENNTLGNRLSRGYTSQDLTGRPGVIYKGTWKSSATGKLLSLNVHPSIIYGVKGECYPTPLSMVSNLFGFYKGTLVYTFHFGTNIFCTGRLKFLSLGGQHLLTDPTVDQVRDLPGVIYSLNMEENYFEVEVPYSGVTTHQTVRKELVFDAGYQGEDLKTRLHVFIQDGLTSNVGSASEIDYIVLVRAGKDFELTLPRNVNTGLQTLLIPQGYPTSMDVSSRIKFNEGSSHRVLIADFGYLWNETVKKGQVLQFYCSPIMHSNTIILNPLSWLSSMFVRWRGSLIYKLQVSIQDKTKAKRVLIWFKPEPVPGEKKEFQIFSSGESPASGERFLTWDPSVVGDFTFVVEYASRYPNLMLPHSDYDSTMIYEPAFYSGSVKMRYLGDEDLTIKCYIRGGDDLELFDRGPLPKITGASFPLPLPYVDTISRVHDTMSTRNELLSKTVEDIYKAAAAEAEKKKRTERPPPSATAKSFSKQVVWDEPINPDDDRYKNMYKGIEIAEFFGGFSIPSAKDLQKQNAPIHVIKRSRKERKAIKQMKSKCSTLSSKGRKEGLFSVAASWVLPKEKTQALDKINLDTCVENINRINEKENFDKFLKLLEKSETIDFEKMTALIDHMSPAITEIKTNEKLQTGLKTDIPNILEGLGKLTSFGTTMLGYLKTLIKGTFPGYISEMIKEEKYGTAVLCSVLGLLALCMWYRAKDSMSVTMKIVTLVTVIWAPIIGSKVLELGLWLRENFCDKMNASLKDLSMRGIIDTDERNKWCVAGKGRKEFGPTGVTGLLDNFGSLVQPLLYLGLGLTSVVTLGLLPGAKQTTTFTEKFCNFSSKCKNLSGIGSGMKMIHEFCNLFSTKIIGWVNWMMGSKALQEDCAINLLVRFDVPTWVKRVNDLTLEENKFTDINAQDHVNEVRGLYDKAMQIQQALVRVVVPSSLSGVLRDTVSKCRDLLNDTHVCKGLGQTRVDPFHMCFYGLPGVGKSASSSISQRDILDHCGYPVTERSYARNPQDRYWSRYFGQPAVEYDDLGAIIGTGESSDYGELINIKSNKAYPLVMADISEKGAMFRSHFVFSSTNSKMLDDKSNVRNKEAIYRRRDLLVEVKRADNAAMVPGDPTSGLTYTVLDSLTGDVRTTWDKNYYSRPTGFTVRDVDYETFIAFAKDYAKSYIDNQKKLVAALTKNRNDIPETILDTRIVNHGFTDTVISSEDEVEEKIVKSYDFFGTIPIKRGFGVKQMDTSGVSLTEEEKLQGLKQVQEKKRVVDPERDIELSIDGMITCYNNLRCTGSMLYAQFGTIDKVWFGNLETMTSSNFIEQLGAMCTCVQGQPAERWEACGSHMIHEILDCDKLRKIGVKMCVTPSGSIILKNVSGAVEQLPAGYSSFVVLLNAIKLTAGSGKNCPFSEFIMGVKSAMMEASEFQDCEKVEDLKIFDLTQEGRNHNGIKVFEWRDVEVYYPKICGDFDGLYLQDHQHFYFISNEKKPETTSVPKLSLFAKSCMDDLMYGEKKFFLPDLEGSVPEEEMLFFRDTLLEVGILSPEMNLNCNQKEVFQRVKDTYNSGPIYILWLLIAVYRSRKIVRENLKIQAYAKKRAQVELSVEVFEQVQRELTSKVSEPISIALGIGGVLLGLAAFGGVIYGSIKLFSFLFSSGEGTVKSIEEHAFENVDIPVIKDLEKIDAQYVQLAGTIQKEKDEIYDPSTKYLSKDINTGKNWKEPTPKRERERLANARKQSVSFKKSSSRMKENQLKIKELRSKIKALESGEEVLEINGRKEASPLQKTLTQSFRGLVERNGTIDPETYIKMNLTAEDFAERDRARDMNTEWQLRMRQKKQVLDTKPLSRVGHTIGSENIVLHGGDEFAVIPKSVVYTDKHYFLQEVNLVEQERHEALEAQVVGGFHEIMSGEFKQEIGRDTIATAPVIKELHQKDKAVMECIDGVIAKAAAQLYFPQAKSKGNCLRICGSWLLFPAHYLLNVEEGQDMALIFTKHVFKLTFDPTKAILVSGLQDLVMYNCGPKVPLATDIRKHFMTFKDIANYVTGSGYMVFTSFGTTRDKVLIEKLETIRLINPDTRISTILYDMDSDTSHTMLSGLSYPALSMPGFCGSAIMTEQTKCPRKLMGIHVASSGVLAIGYAEIVTQELINDTINRFGEVIQIYPKAEEVIGMIPYGRAECNIVMEPKNLAIVGRLPSKLVPQSVSRTDIIRSPLAGLASPIQSAPAILSPYDERLNRRYVSTEQLKGKVDPLIIAVDKYGAKVKEFPSKLINYVGDHLVMHFSTKENSLKRKQVLTLDEAINGIDDTDFWRGLNMSTSPGWPYVLERGADQEGKRWCFNELESFPSGRPRFEIDYEPLERKLSERLDCAKNGMRYPTLTVECPKDERRKLSKIYVEVSTRSFTNLPLDLNILFRMYFQDFTVMIMEQRSKSFSKVGINPDSPEWTHLFHQLREVGEKGFAGDYAKFDGIGPPEIYWSITDVINKWYDDGEENARVRHVLLSEAYDRFSLVRDCVVKINQGLPSGFPMTVIFNCMVNYYFLGMSWVEIMGNSRCFDKASLEDFDRHTRIAVYGDDNVVGVRSEALEFYNLRSVAHNLSKYGITYTDAAKNPIEKSEPYILLEKATFLKRAFSKVNNSGMIFCAPLEPTSITEQVNWIRKSPDIWEAMKQNLHNALYEASLHGKAVYDEFRERVNSALKHVGREVLRRPMSTRELDFGKIMMLFLVAMM